MRTHFPVYDAAKVEWTNLDERDGLNVHLLKAMLDQYIEAPEVLVEVYRKVGDCLPKNEAVSFIAAHIGQGNIRIADREFTSFMVVAQPGVATGWRRNNHDV